MGHDVENPLTAWIQPLQERITTDYGLATHEQAERDEMLGRLTSMVWTDALARAAELLSEDESNSVEQMLEGGGESDPEKAMGAMMYVVSRVPNFSRLLDEAYEEVRALAIKVREEDREKKFEHADQSAEAVGGLLETAEGGTEAAGVEVPGLSVVGIGVDLLLDPARFLRSARERQVRFFKHVEEIFLKLLGTAGSGLLLFTIGDALVHHHVLGPMPKIIKEAVPNWYERQSIGGQVILLFVLAVGSLLGMVVLGRVLIWASSYRRLTPAFELKVRDEELATNALKPLSPEIFPNGVPQETLWSAAKVVYQSIYLNSGSPNSSGMKLLKKILAEGDEKAAVAFLKSKVRHYRSAMQSEAKSYCREADEIMGKIY